MCSSDLIVGRVTGVAVRLVREDDAPDRRKTEHDANGLGLKDGAMKDGVMKDAALLGLAGLRAAAITTG